MRLNAAPGGWRKRKKGGMRCYGYAEDGTTVVPDEAETLQAIAARLLAGDSLRSVIRDTNDAGGATSTGRPWQSVTLRRLLTNPRLAGKQTAKGQVVGDGDWQPIFDAATHEALVTLLNDPARQAGNRPSSRARRYLLTGGLLICGLCGKPLQSQPSNSGKRGYVCRTSPPSHGCGRTRIAAQSLEDAVAERVLARLASPAVRHRLAAAVVGPDGQPAERSLLAYEGRLQQLGVDYAEGLIGRTEFHAGRARVSELLDRTRRAVEADAQLRDLPEANPQSLAVWWSDAPMERRHQLVQVVMEHIVVNPATTRGPAGLDEARLTWIWR